jgi:NAD+ synthase
MSTAMALPDALQIDAAAEVDRICRGIRECLSGFKRQGVVVGVSGGIDSSVAALLCARAVGPERVMALLMPEAESSPDALRLGELAARAAGVPYVVEDLTDVLKAARCYQRREEAIRSVAPEFGEGYKFKIVLPPVGEAGRYGLFYAVIQAPDGRTTRVRLTAGAYLGILAATNFKQRVRKMMEYYYADLLQYAVAGTANRLEHALGFFVKNGDGSADLKPIAHLYKSQVYRLAEHLGAPEEIQRRPPTTDTYTLEQSQEEFYFMLPLEKMDLCLYGKDHGIAPGDLGPVVSLTAAEVERAYAAIASKRNAARYLHATASVIQS